jgi:hypothetical protein
MVSYIRGRGLRTLSDAEIVSRYLAGDSSTDIGLAANCLSDTVLYLVRRAGHQPRPRGGHGRHKVLPLDDEQICKLYRDGISGPLIAERCGTTPATIYAVLRRHDVPRRPAGDTRKAMAAAKARRLRKEPPP